MWNQWSQYAVVQPPLPLGAAPPPPPNEPAQTAPPAPPSSTASQPVMIGPVAPTSATVAPSTAAVAAVPNAATTNPYSQYTAAQYAALTPEQQYTLQQHWQQWQKYQEEYAKWHAQYGEQYKREMEAAANKTNTSTVSYPGYTGIVPPNAQQMDQKATTSTTKITGQPQLYNQPPPQIGPSNQYLTSAPIIHQQPPPPPTQQPYQQDATAPWQNNSSFLNLPPPNFNSPTAANNYPNANNPTTNQWSSAPPSFGNQGNHQPPFENYRPNDKGGKIGPGGGFNDSTGNFNSRDNFKNSDGQNNWNKGPLNNRDSFGGPNNNNRGGPAFKNYDNDPYERRNDPSKSANDVAVPRGSKDSNSIPNDLPYGNYSRNVGSNDWQQSRRSGSNDWRADSKNRGDDDPDMLRGGRDTVRNCSKERDADWKGGSSVGGNDGGGPWQGPGGNNRGINNSCNDWNNTPNNNRADRDFNDWNDGSNNRSRNDSNDWRDVSRNNRGNNRNNRNQDYNNRNFSSRDNDDREGNRDRDFGYNNRNNQRFSGGWNDGLNNRSNNWGENNREGGGPINRSEDLNNQGNNWHGGGPNHGPNFEPNQQIGPSGNSGPPGNSGPTGNSANSRSSGTAGRNCVPDIDEEKFDRQFKQWQDQFEDWKRANANHPDREMYRRYEQEFEKQRTRIMERREQMRRRKMERMGLDPNQPPTNTSSGKNSVVGNETECKQNSRDSSRNRDLSGNINQQRHKESFAENLESSDRQHQAEENVEPDHKEEKGGHREDGERDEEAFKDTDTKQKSPNKSPIERKEDLQDDPESSSGNTMKTAAPISIKFNVQKNTPLGKRKSRFDNNGPPLNKSKTSLLTGGKGNTAEVINLDDEDDEVEGGDRNEVNMDVPNENMSEIFKKTDGIPGLDLVEDGGPSKAPTTGTQSETESTHNSQGNSKKIPSLFDIKVNKPDMVSGKSEVKNPTKDGAATVAPMPDISKTLNDPEFMKKISEAVAKAQGKDDRLPQQDDMRDGSGRPISFAEWQRYKQKQNEIPPNFDNDNAHSNDNMSIDRMSTTKSILEDDVSNASCEASAVVENETKIGHNSNMGSNDFGPNNRGPNIGHNNWGANVGGVPNNWGGNSGGPNGPNNRGGNNSTDGPNNWGNNTGGGGPNNWGVNNSGGGPNNWGCNNNGGGPNNWGGNNGGGPHNWGGNNGGGPNNWGNNSGRPNNWGGNNGGGGPNNWGGNSAGGPNNWGGNNACGPNNWGGGRPNNWCGNNGGGGGPNNWGPNNNNFGPNFQGNRNFGPNGPNGNNFGANNPNFGPSKELNNMNMGRNSPNFGPNRNFGGNNNGPSFSNNTPGHNFGRDGPQMHFDNSDSDQAQRNVNNPFRRNIHSNAPSLDDANSPKPWINGPGDNLDYGDYYRPVQVIDYTNNASVAPKVIDYGHKPVSDDFKPVKVINYDHAPKPNKKAIVTPLERQRRGQKRRNKKKQQREGLLKKQGMTRGGQNNTTQQENAVSNPEREKQLEDISDNEDLPQDVDEERRDGSPAAPPPPMYSLGSNNEGTLAQIQGPSSIFPSTAEANENIIKMTVDHVQMSIPTAENNNTISIEEILMQPGRDSRPKKICIILRGPPGSGKSHVAKLIKEKEKEMSGNNPRVLSIDDYFLIENDYEEKCPKTGKKIPKKEILYEYDQAMEETYMQYLIKSFKKTIIDNFYDFIVIDCNNNSLRTLNEFYCHSKDSGYVPYIVDLFCDLETCMDHNIHDRTESDIKEIINTWKPTPFHYIKLDVSSLLQNVVEMEDAEDMAVDDNTLSENADALNQTVDENDKEITAATADDEENANCTPGDNDEDEEPIEDDSNDSAENCGFLKSKWETDNTSENLARLDGTSKLNSKRKPTMEEYLQMDEWQPVSSSSKGKKRVRWADIEEKREQEKMRAVGFVVGQTDWKRMMDPNAAKRALNKTKYIERVNKQRR